jgi:hypothetical protein
MRTKYLAIVPSFLVFCDQASAETFFCSPAPIETATFRSSTVENSSITVAIPNLKPFWFDDVTGDYLPHEGGSAQVDGQKIDLPLAFSTSPEDRLRTWVAITFEANQCIEAAFGVVPAPSTN